MDSITSEQVETLATLSRLGMTDKERVTITDTLSGALDHFSAIADIDTSSESGHEDASGLRNVVREDVAIENRIAKREDIISQLPHKKDDYLQVPGVFTESSVS